jgi:hypothetical protein
MAVPSHLVQSAKAVCPDLLLPLLTAAVAAVAAGAAAAAAAAAAAGNTLNRLPSLGTTPAGKSLPSNANNLMSWLQGIPLAASAAKSPYRPGHMQPPARLLDV